LLDRMLQGWHSPNSPSTNNWLQNACSAAASFFVFSHIHISLW
jgi:hypothetical protein